jgi:hypothetical protein
MNAQYSSSDFFITSSGTSNRQFVQLAIAQLHRSQFVQSPTAQIHQAEAGQRYS